MVLTKREVGQFIIAVIVLGLVLGFNDPSEVFQFSYWLTNYLIVAAVAAIILFLYIIMQKCMAASRGAETQFQIWSMYRYGLKRQKTVKQGIPVGVIIPLIVTIVTLGRIACGTVASSHVQTNERLRLGRKLQEITDFEKAMILAAGPYTAMIISVIMPMFDPSSFALLFKKAGLVLAISNMLPLPGLDGMKIFLSSPALYIFSVVLIISAGYFMTVLGTGIALLIAGMLACMLLICFWLFVIYKK